MISFFAPYKKFFIFFLLLSIVIIYSIYTLLVPPKSLPIYTPNQIDTTLVDSTQQDIRKYHRIPDFSLTNHLGEIVTQKNYHNTVYVTDFFFTTCQTICPKMTQNMGLLQEKLKGKPVKLLSHTVMPEVDTIPVLKKYAKKHHVNPKVWNLVTGSKKEIYDLARKAYLVAKLKPYSKYDLIHTENFVLIDQKKRIRGFYDGTDLKALDQLLEDIDFLLEKNN